MCPCDDNNRHRRVSLSIATCPLHSPSPCGWRANVAYHLVFLFASQEAFAVCSDLCYFFINTSLDISCQRHQYRHHQHHHLHPVSKHHRQQKRLNDKHNRIMLQFPIYIPKMKTEKFLWRDTKLCLPANSYHLPTISYLHPPHGKSPTWINLRPLVGAWQFTSRGKLTCCKLDNITAGDKWPGCRGLRTPAERKIWLS